MTALPALLLVALAAEQGPPRVEVADRSVVDLRPEVLIYAHFYEGPFVVAAGVYCDPLSGEVYVADQGLNAIGIFDEKGSPLYTFTSDMLRNPSRVITDREGLIYVLDSDSTRIKVFSYRGEFLRDLELPALQSVKDRAITAIAFDAEGNLYVGDSKSGQVLVFDPARQLKARIGRKGTGRGQLSYIVGIATDAEHVYVADAEATAVQVFTRYGRYLRGWGYHEAGAHNVSFPSGIAVDAKGRIVLVDKMRQEIKYFESDGRMIDAFGGYGAEPGAVSFPTDVSIDRRGRLCVADSGNARVQVMSPVEAPPKPEKEAPAAPGR